jgi:hypothetical protein
MTIHYNGTSLRQAVVVFVGVSIPGKVIHRAAAHGHRWSRALALKQTRIAMNLPNQRPFLRYAFARLFISSNAQ